MFGAKTDKLKRCRLPSVSHRNCSNYLLHRREVVHTHRPRHLLRVGEIGDHDGLAYGPVACDGSLVYGTRQGLDLRGPISLESITLRGPVTALGPLGQQDGAADGEDG
jgi:hypothetical protein